MTAMIESVSICIKPSTNVNEREIIITLIDDIVAHIGKSAVPVRLFCDVIPEIKTTLKTNIKNIIINVGLVETVSVSASSIPELQFPTS